MISRSHGYHGTHGIGTSILGMPYREGFGPLLEDTSQVEWDSAVALEEEIQRVGAERVAAFVFEPVIGAGGVRVPPPGYLDEAVARLPPPRRARDRRLRDRRLRPARRLARRRALPPASRPDHVCEGRHERVPAARRRHRRRPRSRRRSGTSRAGCSRHGATYAGHATCCAAALANLDILARDDLVHRALELEADFHATLSELTSHPLMGEVRGGVGLMAGVALDPDAIADDPSLVARFVAAAREAGVATRGLRDGLAIAPPLIIELAEVGEIRDRLGEALDSDRVPDALEPVLGSPQPPQRGR